LGEMDIMSSKILLIVARSDRRWEEILRKAAIRVGKPVDVIADGELDSIESWSDYALVIVDASFIKDLIRAVTDIRSRNPDVCIVVFSPAPQWKEAKDVILAGAADYELKSSRGQDIYLTLNRNLAKIAVGDTYRRETS